MALQDVSAEMRALLTSLLPRKPVLVQYVVIKSEKFVFLSCDGSCRRREQPAAELGCVQGPTHTAVVAQPPVDCWPRRRRRRMPMLGEQRSCDHRFSEKEMVEQPTEQGSTEKETLEQSAEESEEAQKVHDVPVEPCHGRTKGFSQESKTGNKETEAETLKTGGDEPLTARLRQACVAMGLAAHGDFVELAERLNEQDLQPSDENSEVGMQHDASDLDEYAYDDSYYDSDDPDGELLQGFYRGFYEGS